MHADIGDRKLCYERRGSGEPLLLIMGMAGHMGMWRKDFLDLLDADFDVVVYDNRGIGDSTDVAGQFTIAQLAEDAVHLLDHLGWASAHVFGISMGGMIAQELVLNHPDRVRRLVLGCTYCGGPRTDPMAPGPMRMMSAMSSGVLEDAIRAGYEANLSPTWTADDAHWSEFHDIALSERVPTAVVLRQAQAAFAHDTSTRLPAVATPTLVIAGTVDEMVLYPNNEVIAELIPGATMYPLADVGHLFWWERPDECAAAIRGHLLS
ncbi:MAG: alpha/beta fold hydrolase [Jatrophihabitantaceae bacterium]